MHRVIRVVAWVALLAGLALVGYVAWQFWGTNYQSKQAQADAVDRVEREWRKPTGEASVSVPQGTVAALVRIPRFGDDYVIPVLDGVSDEALAAGYGHFEDSAQPGRVGNFALAAHRVTHGEPLRDMPELVPGDEIVVTTRDREFTYELITGGDDLTVTFNDTWVVDPIPTNPDAGGVQPPQREGQRLITLTTCSEIFHTDGRLIAFGHLVSTRPMG